MEISYTTIGGYAGLAVVGAGYWYLARRKNLSKAQKPASKPVDGRKDGKFKKQQIDGGHSSGDQGNISREKKQKKKPKVTKPIDEVKPSLAIPPAHATDHDRDDELDNREFARQLQNAKSGKIQAPQAAEGSRQKSVKQSRAKTTSIPVPQTTNGHQSFDEVSAPSSNAGAEADDDMSAANSPTLGAAESKNSGRNDVSDMLESSGSGPSVLRITEPSKPMQPKKKTAPQAFETAETKKQRQNRKKNEARKAELEETEKERRVLLEKQRRTAREAEGRAAKDGSTFMASKAPTNSAWTGTSAPAAPHVLQNQPTNGRVELLDTYDSSSKPSVPQTANLPKVNGEFSVLPSEEEQLKMIEEDAAWNTVTKTKKGKKKGTATEASDVEVKEKASSDRPISSTFSNGTHPGPSAPKREAPKAVTQPVGGVESSSSLVDAEWEVS